jgi:hypothetical protein
MRPERINADKPHLWKADVAASVDQFNQRFTRGYRKQAHPCGRPLWEMEAATYTFRMILLEDLLEPGL